MLTTSGILLAVGGLGAVALGGFTDAAEAVTDATGSTLAPQILGSGAVAILAGAVAEILRRFASGSIIARSTRDYETEQSAAIVAAGQREARVMQSAEDMQRTVEAVERTMRETREESTSARKEAAAAREEAAAARKEAAAARDDLREIRTTWGPR